MSEDRSACGRAFGDVLGGLKLKNECSIGVDASTSGSDLEMKKMLEIKKDQEMKKMLEIKKGLEVPPPKKRTAWTSFHGLV